jgi:hypothetical protein
MQPPKTKDPTDPTSGSFFLSLTNCAGWGSYHWLSIVTMHARHSQPKYIHLTVTTQIYSFGHSTEFLIWSWDLVYAQNPLPPPPQKEREEPQKLRKM